MEEQRNDTSSVSPSRPSAVPPGAASPREGARTCTEIIPPSSRLPHAAPAASPRKGALEPDNKTSSMVASAALSIVMKRLIDVKAPKEEISRVARYKPP